MLLEENMGKKRMIYVSPREKRIEFDAWEDDVKENGIFWVDMCPTCHNKYKGILGKRAHKDGSGVASCYVCGCENTNADWYIDFDPSEVIFE